MTDGPRFLILNSKPANVNAFLTAYVRQGFEAVLGRENVFVTEPHRVAADARELCPDCVLCFDGQAADPVILARLRARTPCMVLWLTEDPYERSRNTRIVSFFDLVFTNDAGSIAYYEHARVHHLPLAASPLVHDLPVRERDSEYLYDCLFVGVGWPNRTRFLRRLRPLLVGCRVRMVVPHNEFLRPANLGVPEFEVDQRISNADLAILHNRARTVLYLDRDFSGGRDPGRATSPGPRLFEAALSGGLQLAEASAPGVEACLQKDREIFTFETPEECAELVRHFRSHPDERIAAARAARDRARREHLYEHRAREIAKHVRAVLSDRPRFGAARATTPAGQLRTVLYVAHNSVDTQPFGGTEVHLDQTFRSLPEPYRPIAYFPDNSDPDGRRMLLVKRQPGGRMVKQSFRLESKHDPLACRDAEREELLARILVEEEVEIVHFFHLLGHPPSLLEVAHRHGVQSILSVPDHYMVCSRFTLIDANDVFCWPERPPLASCDICLHRTDGLVAGSQQRRRTLYARTLELADAIHCLSPSHASILLEAYPHLKSKVNVFPWGIEAERFTPLRSQPRRSGPLTVAVVGNFARHKGAEALIFVFNALRDDPRVRFVIIGRVDPPYDAILSQLSLKRLTLVGEYEPSELPAHLAGVDVAVFASTWAETFVLTLSECWAAGIVPIANPIGALADRVVDGENGLLLRRGDAGHIVDAIVRLLEDEQLLARLRRGAREMPVVTVAEVTAAYTKLYDGLVDLPQRPALQLPTFRTPDEGVSSAYPRRLRVWGARSPSEEALTQALVRPSPVNGEGRGDEYPAALSAWSEDAVRSRTSVHETAPPMLRRPRATIRAGEDAGVGTAVHVWGSASGLAAWEAVGCAPEGDDATHADWFWADHPDPWLVSPEVDLDWMDFDGVVISMAAYSPAGFVGAQLFWQSHDRTGYSEELSLRLVVRADGRVRHHVVRPLWSSDARAHSTIRRLRLDPLNRPGVFLVESIALFTDRPPASVARSPNAKRPLGGTLAN
jgi:glycosyltransferase involved in cell wall biosynthesis